MTNYEKYAHPMYGPDELGFLSALSAGVGLITKTAATVSPLASLFGKKKKSDPLKKALPFLLMAQQQQAAAPPPPPPPPPAQPSYSTTPVQTRDTGSMLPLIAIAGVGLMLMMKK